MKKSILLFLLLLIISGVSGKNVQVNNHYLKWWQDSRFGMFIHWGPVTRFGGEISWSRESYGKARYDSLYKGFNPVKFNPEEWVALAQKAGMKYIVFTANCHS